MFIDKISLGTFFLFHLNSLLFGLQLHAYWELWTSPTSLFYILLFFTFFVSYFGHFQFSNLIPSNLLLSLSILFLIPHTYFSVISYFSMMSNSLEKVIHMFVFRSFSIFFSILITMIIMYGLQRLFSGSSVRLSLELYYFALLFLLVLAVPYYLFACLVIFNCM